MLILVRFPQKSSFCANVKFIDFEMALRVGPPLQLWQWEILQENFLLGGGNMTRTVFDHLNLF